MLLNNCLIDNNSYICSLLNKINNELAPNKITYNGLFISFNDKIKLFDGDINNTISYLNGLYQGINIMKIYIK